MVAPMAALSEQQIDRFWRDGYVMAENAVSPAQLDALRAQLDAWIDNSRAHEAPWGDTGHAFPRFDIETGHNPTTPRMRRVNNPAEIAEAYETATFGSAMTQMVVDLIGPDVKFHHGKINVKLAHTDSRVGLHQDFSYTPHTNDDIVTALLLLDDMTPENGPLQVAPGSHTDGQISLWQDDRFSGQVSADAAAGFAPRLVPLTGRAGDVCLMHTSVMHGSSPNRSDDRRALLISVYTAADAFMLCPSPLPNRFEGLVVAGHAARRARLTKTDIELPSLAHQGSFFNLSGQGTNAG
jgi:ectoine hydroxylase-related dioxygenase (phytanoyl-CoA dioxygenase family)